MTFSTESYFSVIRRFLKFEGDKQENIDTCNFSFEFYTVCVKRLKETRNTRGS